MIELSDTVENFVALNTIKYADPIQWNITSQYEANTVVVDPQNGTAYISSRPVPAGVALSNTDYWSVIFTLDMLSANDNITFRDDGSNVLSTFASNAGDWLLWNGNLYRVSQNINTNEAYVVGYNLDRYTVELFIKDYVTEILTIIGDLNDLNTTDKDSIVDAINSILPMIGDLNDLDTTDKTSIVNAINEVIQSMTDRLNNLKYYVTPEEYGAVGDGITDDTQAFEDAFRSGYPVYCLPNKTYIVGEIVLSDITHIILNGHGSTIKGTTIHVNTSPGSTSRTVATALLNEFTDINFIADADEVALHLGSGALFKGTEGDEYNTFCEFTREYIDDIKWIDGGFRNYSRGNGAPKITHYQGDLVYFERCHSTGNKAYMPNYILETTYVNSATFIECISVGVHFKAPSNASFIDCLYNIGNDARITSDSDASIVTCRNCSFVGVRWINRNKNIKYVDCIFRESKSSGGTQGITVEQFNEYCENCKIVTAFRDNALSDDNIFNSNNLNKKDYDYVINNAESIIAGSQSVLTLRNDQGVEGVPESGIYKYYVVPSMSGDYIIRNRDDYFNNPMSVNLNAGEGVVFRNRHEFNPAYKHVFRESPSGTIHKAVVPPSSRIGIDGAYLVDNGVMSGFKWEVISALPTLASSSVNMVNGVVSNTDPALPIGSINRDASGWMRQKLT